MSSTPPPTSRKVFADCEKDELPTLKDVAQLIKTGKAKKIIIMVGAGISTAAGIPDFRSPETDFMQHPSAFFTLAKELYPGNFKPTLTHYFFTLLDQKGHLLRCFTQNIDTLETMAGLPREKVVEAHGSFSNATCLNCKSKKIANEIRNQIEKGKVVRCDRKSCQGNPLALIKPDIVFFGEGLPTNFFVRLPDFEDSDLLLVIGTSLQVQPFASLINKVSTQCPRLLINLEIVSEMSYRHDDGFDFKGVSRGGKEFCRDVFYEGKSDEACLQLSEYLGWKSELLSLYKDGHEQLSKTSVSIATPEKSKLPNHAATFGKQKAKLDDDEEEDKLTRDKSVDDLIDAVNKVEIKNEASTDESQFEDKEEK